MTRFQLAFGLAVLVVGCATTKSGSSGPPSRLSSQSEMARVPATTFSMGSNTGETDENPVHEVSLKSFLLDRTEVTNDDYDTCVDAGVCKPSKSSQTPGLNGGKQPVTGVSWRDADAFCEWVGKRLPSEAEFERAIRGATGRVYPWEGAFEPKYANFRGDGDGFKLTAPVGSFPMAISQEAPVLDLVGNAAEWVYDWYDPSYYRSQEEWVDPKGPASPSGEKVVRGGSYLDPEYAARGSSRGRLEINQASNAIGFRCAAD